MNVDVKKGEPETFQMFNLVDPNIVSGKLSNETKELAKEKATKFLSSLVDSDDFSPQTLEWMKDQVRESGSFILDSYSFASTELLNRSKGPVKGNKTEELLTQLEGIVTEYEREVNGKPVGVLGVLPFIGKMTSKRASNKRGEKLSNILVEAEKTFKALKEDNQSLVLILADGETAKNQTDFWIYQLIVLRDSLRSWTLRISNERNDRVISELIGEIDSRLMVLRERELVISQTMTAALTIMDSNATSENSLKKALFTAKEVIPTSESIRLIKERTLGSKLGSI